MLGENFMDYTCHVFSEMRLMVEGAVTLFEEDAGVLCRLAKEADEHDAYGALNDIGTALYEFRRQIKLLQTEHQKETQRQAGCQKSP